MRYFDVFNGDADGICALHQLRLADPLDSTLVTGLKRDIALLNRYLRGRYAVWAAVGAFGDAFDEAALELARPLRLDEGRLALLRELGASLNYSAYGETEADVLVKPMDLYRIVSHY